MLKVGLTGGIGSGKSEVARRLAERGAIVIDADKIAREVVEPGTPGLAEIVQAFGDEVLRPDGTLDRARLGSIVFADPEKLKILNGIVHPKVGARMAELEQAAPPDAVVVYDVPLLAENGLAPLYDLVIVVDAADETRIKRLTTLRGMPEQDARARIAAQASREERLKIADIVIENEGSLEDLDARVAEVWQELRARRDQDNTSSGLSRRTPGR
ncbi:dephospho-CoA kinase [Thermobispora bispora]|uniref:Dephospho-CoA kinase n=1 Tax=Thermobispora bispora (strain ATCC 19993 / DSM 43833 / CBS 139.67 / JCM 10125 / KCTC 9307 / NBRC 14880 / R51) TaxID=469371 RepID=D6YA54_THEBD|nr:dephospho-CoA kinase [Thermobispora bispora]MBO2474092.1 dephospho-CoA kinase [Actinomycetales bacterium]MDI9581013.1 dephospho-CoA kinase [Thermobispora sp.]ADG88197.1 dephospho-CoA kinase [Thermobispora bispora DSM 43833]MBX6167365.1 dephospho-CoA kinase [Thermobispora bispora]QSI48033.1 dephospho-CoA kinase [Thermobispora bispora]